MSMNIKSDEAHRLAREFAALEQTSMTEAVVISLREALARRRAEGVKAERLARMRAISSSFAELERNQEGPSLWEINADLYDEVGLPR
jgi:hypothetical protein